MTRRAVQHYHVVERAKGHPYGLSERGDFRLRFRGEVAAGLPDTALPYCFEPATERLLFVVVDAVAPTLQAPFAYRSLYERARGLIAFPVERTNEFRFAPVERPLLVFSVGRCGSTLVSSLLNETGRLSISEPDALCGFGFLRPSQVPEIGLGVLGSAMRTSLHSFEHHAGSAVAIKFRSQCNRAVGLYRRALGEGRFVFMLRNAWSWAESVHRAFGEAPSVMVDRLNDGIMAYDRLVEGGAKPALVWYEDLQAEPGRAVEAVIERPLTARETQAVAEAMRRDSQAGTTLDQARLRARRPDTEALAAFRAAWLASAPHGLIEKHGLQRLL